MRVKDYGLLFDGPVALQCRLLAVLFSMVANALSS